MQNKKPVQNRNHSNANKNKSKNNKHVRPAKHIQKQIEYNWKQTNKQETRKQKTHSNKNKQKKNGENNNKQSKLKKKKETAAVFWGFKPWREALEGTSTPRRDGVQFAVSFNQQKTFSHFCFLEVTRKPGRFSRPRLGVSTENSPKGPPAKRKPKGGAYLRLYDGSIPKIKPKLGAKVGPLVPPDWTLDKLHLKLARQSNDQDHTAQLRRLFSNMLAPAGEASGPS